MFVESDFLRLRSMADIFDISPRDFEWFAKLFLERLGYQSVWVTEKYGEHQSDGGIDLHCVKAGVKYYVQCKKWRFGFKEHMKIAPIRELGGCMWRDKITAGIFLSTMLYDEMSRIEARKMNIELIGDREIADYMRSINPKFKDSRKHSLLWKIWRACIRFLRLLIWS